MSESLDNEFQKDDIEHNKLVSAIGYFVFFLPLLVAPHSAFARYHANQGLVLLIFAMGFFVVTGVIAAFYPLIILLFTLVWILFSLLMMGLAVIGMLRAINGHARPLPFIGKIVILK